MSLPALDKSYAYNVNQAIVTSGVINTDCQKALFAIVNAMVGFALMPWLVVGSSNGVGSFSMAGTNYWAASGNLIWGGAGANHSWIVLKSQVIGVSGGGGLQVCFDLNQVSTPYRMNVIVSATAGFTGGSATARPTATDEQVIFASGIAWISSAPQNNVVHVWQSTDGAVFNAVLFSANVAQFSIHASVPKNPIANWTKPCVYWALSSSIVPLFKAATMYSGANASAWIASSAALYLTGEAVNNVLIETYQSFSDDQTGEWPFGPIGLYCQTAGNRGRKGQMFDVWWGSTVNASGDNYPADGSKQFVQFGDMIFPWNGSTALTS